MNQDLDLDTTGDGNADATNISYTIGTEYNYYTEDETKIFDVTPPQVFKMKMTEVNSGTDTLYTLYNDM